MRNSEFGIRNGGFVSIPHSACLPRRGAGMAFRIPHFGYAHN